MLQPLVTRYFAYEITINVAAAEFSMLKKVEK